MDLLTSLLPFLLLIGFWWFLMHRVRSGKGFPSPSADTLEEICKELEGIRHALEHDPYRKS